MHTCVSECANLLCLKRPPTTGITMHVAIWASGYSQALPQECACSMCVHACMCVQDTMHHALKDT